MTVKILLKELLKNKKSILVISAYRSGTKLLRISIRDLDKSVKNYTEILEFVTDKDECFEVLRDCLQQKSLVTVNCAIGKKTLLQHKDYIFNNFYVIKLTRQDNITHYISDYIYLYDTEKYPHHGANKEAYFDLPDKICQDLPSVLKWVLDKKMLRSYNAHFSLDYEDLKTLSDFSCNDYGDLTLESLFTNSEKIKNILLI